MTDSSASVQASAFLQAIFGDKPETHQILIWTLRKTDDEEIKRNTFFADINKAAEYATKPKPDGTDVYFGVGTLATKPHHGRGKADDISGIGAIHLDLDIAHAGAHQKSNLPPDLQTALAFIKTVPLPPSIIVHSGYGLHLYWLLKKFWHLMTKADRAAARAVIEAWQQVFKWRAAQQQWTVDATQDLTRVLRVPGTQNWKLPTAQPLPVAHVLQIEAGTRYNVADFERVTGAQDAQPGAGGSKAARTAKNAPQGTPATNIKPLAAPGNTFKIDPQATVPSDIFESMIENVPKFRTTWARKRTDLQDSSASSYDMAIANLCVATGLDDQTTVNFIIAHRRKYNAADEKMMRADYLQRTLDEAKRVHGDARIKQQAIDAPVDVNDKESVRQQILQLIGVRIEKIERHMTSPPHYVLHFSGGRYINIGGSKNLLEQKLFRQFAFDATNETIKGVKPAIWEATTAKMGALVEVIEVADEATELGEVREILRDYLSEQLPRDITATQHRQNITHFHPAIIDGAVAVHARTLWSYGKRVFGIKMTKAEFVSKLKRLGAESDNVVARDERQKVCHIAVYMLPADWTPTGAVRVAADDAEQDDTTSGG